MSIQALRDRVAHIKDPVISAALAEIAALESQLAEANERAEAAEAKEANTNKYYYELLGMVEKDRRGGGVILAAHKRHVEIEGHLKDAQMQIATLTAQINTHRRFHDKAGCPGGDNCYVCRIDANSAWPTEDGEGADKWALFPRLAQATTEARLRAEAAEARLAEANGLINAAARQVEECTASLRLVARERDAAEARAEAAGELATNLRAELDATRLRANTLEDFNDEWEGRAEEAQAEVVRLTNVLTRIRDERGVRPYYVAREALRPDRGRGK